VLRRYLLIWSVASLPTPPGCGGKEAHPGPNQPVCAKPQGTFATVFTLKQSEGTCSGAKSESHDNIAFDRQGNFVSPVEGLIKCFTIQNDCHIQVRCTSTALPSALGSLDADLNPNADQLTGVGTVSGSYDGCQKVVYDVRSSRSSGP
jgi:hypothetical protein